MSEVLVLWHAVDITVDKFSSWSDKPGEVIDFFCFENLTDERLVDKKEYSLSRYEEFHFKAAS